MSAPETTLLQGGTLVTMDPARRVFVGDMRLEHGRIAALGPRLDPTGARVVNLAGLHVLPGLVQGHTHLGQALLRGLAEGRDLLRWLRERIWPLEAAHNHDSAYWSGMLGAADCLLAGTTTIQDIGVVTAMDGVFEAIRDSGLRAVAGKCLMDQGQGVPAALVESVAQIDVDVRASVARWHGAAGGRISTVLCPRFILSCSADLWRLVVELAGELDLGVHTHLLEHPREEQEVRQCYGAGQLEFLDALGVLDTRLSIAHGVQFTVADGERLAGRALGVVHCPSANLKLGSGVADLALLRRTPGVVLGLGCDGAPCNNDMDVLEEIRLAALLQGLKAGPGAVLAVEILAMATCDGAAAMGLGDLVGSLEVGKAADAVVLDLERPQSFGDEGVEVYDRVVYGAGRDGVRHVFIDGIPRVVDGALVTMDCAEVMARSREAVRGLLRRADLGQGVLAR